MKMVDCMTLDKKLNELYKNLKDKWKQFEEWENQIRSKYLEKWKSKDIEDIYQFIKYPMSYELMNLILEKESKYYKLNVKTNNEYDQLFNKFLELKDKKFKKDYVKFNGTTIYSLEDLFYITRNSTDLPFVFLETSYSLGLNETSTMNIFENYLEDLKSYYQSLYEFIDMLTNYIVKRGDKNE